MKTRNQITVLWKFPTHDFSAESGFRPNKVYAWDEKGNRCVLDSLEIKSSIYPHPAGRCVSVVVNVINSQGHSVARTQEMLRTKREGLTDEIQMENQKKFGYLKITSSEFPGVVGHDGRAYSVQWLLRKNEEFLDGAVRIGCEILKGIEASGDYRKKYLLGNFSVTQRTFVEIKDPAVKGDNAATNWQPIECWLRFKHGLQE